MQTESEKNMKEFGQKLAQLRKNYRSKKYSEKGPTLRQLGEDAGVDYSLIGAVEKGRKRAGKLTLRKIAGALQLDEMETREFVSEGSRAYSLVEALQMESLKERLSPRIQGEMLQALFPQIPRSIAKMNIIERQDRLEVVAKLEDGRFCVVDASVIFGESEEDVAEKLKEKREALGEEESPIVFESTVELSEKSAGWDLH